MLAQGCGNRRLNHAGQRNTHEGLRNDYQGHSNDYAAVRDAYGGLHKASAGLRTADTGLECIPPRHRCGGSAVHYVTGERVHLAGEVEGGERMRSKQRSRDAAPFRKLRSLRRSRARRPCESGWSARNGSQVVLVTAT